MRKRFRGLIVYNVDRNANKYSDKYGVFSYVIE